jgi:hypothetical protein
MKRRFQMRHRSFTLAGAVLVASATIWLTVGVAGQESTSQTSTFKVPEATYSPPKLPWGDPDLQGVWDNHSNVPMQRAANLGLKKTYTDEELKRREEGRGDNEPLCNRRDESCEKASVEALDRIRAYNSFWATRETVYDNRTSLIEDPPNGRIPPMTPQAIAIQEAHNKIWPPTAGGGNSDIVIDHYKGYDIAERCIAAQSPAATMGYNSAQYLMQSPGWVMLAHERLNTRVIPLDGRPFLGGTMGGWMGDSRGRWEGNTLVVETKHYTNKQNGGSVGAFVDAGIPFTNFHIIERFVPVGPKRLHYYVTVIDPTTWTRPWTWMTPWEKDRILPYEDEVGTLEGDPEPYQIYEYACHEGNYTMGTTLKAAKQARETPQVQAASAPASALVSSLLGQSEAQIRELFGEPEDIAGPRWRYSTTDGVVVFYAFFEDGKLVRTRPEALPIADVVKTK